MVNGGNRATWEEQTLAMLKRAREERRRAEDKVVYLVHLTEALEAVLELTRQRRILKLDARAIDPERLRKQSVRGSLIEIAKSNNGLIVAPDAINILVEAGVYNDRSQARGMVYSVLSRDGKRSGEHFEKERPGIYRLIGDQHSFARYGV